MPCFLTFVHAGLEVWNHELLYSSLPFYNPDEEVDKEQPAVVKLQLEFDEFGEVSEVGASTEHP